MKGNPIRFLEFGPLLWFELGNQEEHRNGSFAELFSPCPGFPRPFPLFQGEKSNSQGDRGNEGDGRIPSKCTLTKFDQRDLARSWNPPPFPGPACSVSLGGPWVQLRGLTIGQRIFIYLFTFGRSRIWFSTQPPKSVTKGNRFLQGRRCSNRAEFPPVLLFFGQASGHQLENRSFSAVPGHLASPSSRAMRFGLLVLGYRRLRIRGGHPHPLFLLFFFGGELFFLSSGGGAKKRGTRRQVV